MTSTADLVRQNASAVLEDLRRALYNDDLLTKVQKAAMRAAIKAAEAFEREPKPEPKVMDRALSLTDESEIFRVIVFDRTDYGDGLTTISVFDIFKSPDIDALWEMVSKNRPDVNAVCVDGNFVRSENLTIWEAAEAAFR